MHTLSHDIHIPIPPNHNNSDDFLGELGDEDDLLLSDDGEY